MVPVVLGTMSWPLLPLPPLPLPLVLTARSTSSSEIRTILSGPRDGMIYVLIKALTHLLPHGLYTW